MAHRIDTDARPQRGRNVQRAPLRPPGRSAPRLPAVEAGDGLLFAFRSRDGGGVPVTWLSGRVIPVYVNPAGSPTMTFASRVTRAISLTVTASGLPLQFAGFTSTPPQEWICAGGEGVAVGWVPSTTDLGGAAATVTSLIETTGPTSTYVAASIALGADADRDRGCGPRSWAATILHEFGHVCGLDHVDDPAQIMSVAGRRTGTFGLGDLCGLAILGQIARERSTSPLRGIASAVLSPIGDHASWVPPAGHPCEGHVCDGCATCRSGSCCASHSSAAPLFATNLDLLRELIIADAALRGRRELVRIAAGRIAHASPPTRTMADRRVVVASPRRGNEAPRALPLGQTAANHLIDGLVGLDIPTSPITKENPQ